MAAVELKRRHAGGAPGNPIDHDSSSTGPRPLVKVWAVALLLYALIVPTGQVGPQAATFINDIAWTIAAALAAISSWRAARSLAGRHRAAWLIFALACAAWTAGQLAWNVYQLYFGIPLPFPSLADAGYLAFGPLMILGLFVLRATQQERRLTGLRVANLGMILCSLAIVLINTLAQPFGEAPRSLGSSLIVLAENASLALAFVVAIYFLWSYRWGDQLPACTLLTLSLGAQMISGLLFTRGLMAAEYSANSLFNAGWLVAFALHQWAAQTQVAHYRRQEDSIIRQGQDWVEALVPSFLLLWIAVTAALIFEELAQRTIYLGALVLAAFAVILASREAWLYSRGLQLRAELDDSAKALARAHERLQAVDAQRRDLERVIEVTARAGKVGLWEWDLSSNCMRFSREWKRLLGYEEHEVADNLDEWSTRVHPEDSERILGDLQNFVANPTGEYVSEQRLRHRDGSYIWILSQAAMLFDGAGRPERMLGSTVNITSFKQLEQSLRDSERRYRELADALESRVARRTQELSDAYRESQNFAYAVAHDLKAPLRAINGFCALLEQSAGGRLTEDEHRYIDRARQGALRMAALIDDLLAYSRIEHREQRLVPIDCRQFVEDLLGSMADSIQETGAEVRVDLDSSPVLADSEGLRIVLTNLLGNALKFSRRAHRPRIDIDSAAESGRYILRVRDNGIGFDPAYREKIFEIFNRLHASGYEGTGIGLALVRKALHRMGGEVWAEALPGKGATFFVSLQLAG